EPWPIAQVANERLALRVPGLRGLVVVLPIGDAGRPGQALRPGRGQPGGARHLENSIEPLPAFAKMAAQLPEPPHRVTESEGRLGLASLDRPGQRGPDVVVVMIHRLNSLA